jgi:C4-dicarboxylate-specific signal transduction histidine kinase
MNAVVRSKKVAGLALLASVASAVMCWINPPLWGDRQESVTGAEAWLNAFAEQVTKAQAQDGQGGFVYVGPTREQWLHMERVFGSLSYPNVDVARARALNVLPERPQWVLEYQWADRAVVAKRNWTVWGTWDLLTMVLRVAAAVGVASWLAMVLLVVAWYFFLDRVRELMAAVRGESVG